MSTRLPKMSLPQPFISTAMEPKETTTTTASASSSDATGLPISVASLAHFHPRLYHATFHAHQLRVDGRTFMEYRDFDMSNSNIRNVDNCVLMQCGQTRILATITCEIISSGGKTNSTSTSASELDTLDSIPQSTSNFASSFGRLSIHFSSISSLFPSMNKSSASTDKSVDRIAYLCEYLERMYSSNSVLNWTQFHTTDGQSPWRLCIELCCLSYDGNLLDCAWIALMRCLLTLKLPTVKRDDTGTYFIISPPPQQSHNLSQEIQFNRHYFTSQRLTIPVTFACVNGEYMVDPTAEEESISTGTLTILYNEKEELVSVIKNGGDEVGEEKMKEYMRIAKEYVKTIARRIYTLSSNRIGE